MEKAGPCGFCDAAQILAVTFQRPHIIGSVCPVIVPQPQHLRPAEGGKGPVPLAVGGKVQGQAVLIEGQEPVLPFPGLQGKGGLEIVVMELLKPEKPPAQSAPKLVVPQEGFQDLPRVVLLQKADQRVPQDHGGAVQPVEAAGHEYGVDRPVFLRVFHDQQIPVALPADAQHQKDPAQALGRYGFLDQVHDQVGEAALGQEGLPVPQNTGQGGGEELQDLGVRIPKGTKGLVKRHFGDFRPLNADIVAHDPVGSAAFVNDRLRAAFDRTHPAAHTGEVHLLLGTVVLPKYFLKAAARNALKGRVHQRDGQPQKGVGRVHHVLRPPLFPRRPEKGTGGPVDPVSLLLLHPAPPWG